jgi:O-antigen ligase
VRPVDAAQHDGLLAATRRFSAGALVLAAAIPILFLHVHYQPGFGIGVGSTTIDAYLSDFAVLAVALAALHRGLRDGFAPLSHGRWIWVAGACFFAWVAAAVVYGHLHDASYAWRTHGVTAAKFAEYALLAPAVPLLIRRAADVLLPLWSLVLWSCFATGVGVAQFFGAAIFFTGTVGRRQASFLSSGDFAALSTAVLLVGVAAVALPRLRLGRALGATAVVSGAIGTIVAGSIASVLGLATAVVALLVVLLLRREIDMRRLAVLAAAGVVVLAGTVAIRGSDLDAFARFLGASPSSQTEPPSKIQTYAHRTLLVWFGFEIWKDSPVIGVGWEGSAEPANFMPHVPAAHARFPDEAPLAFPAPDRQYGVQNVWVEALADLGVVGFALWTALFAAGLWLSARSAIVRGSGTALLGLAWLALLVWLWTGQGFVAGIPLDALTWLAFGVAATRIERS